MNDSLAGAHHLDFARVHAPSVAEAILVLQLALQDVSDDLHIAVWVRWKSSTAGDDVVVENAQRTPIHVLRIVVLAEGKVPARVEPAKVLVMSFFGWNDGDHGVSPLPCHDIRCNDYI